MNKRTKRNFTLIELLVVMLLMGVLMTLMLPAFKRMISGNQVQQLASNLKLGLEQAQSHAITSRRYVALILPNSATGVHSEYQLGGYRLAYINKQKNKKSKNWVFAGWVPTSEWHQPESEAKLLMTVDDQNNKYDDFTEGKGLEVSNSPANISFDGLLDIKKYDDTAQEAQKSAIIFSPYGGIVGGKSLRLVIAEALINGNKFIFPSRDTTGPTNFLILEINRFSGRVRYYQP
ncbi:pilus assembly FimT family protein [Victivallis vadensis]|uniref:pilus assembly FimT family protein n=1 Tax=Victivallis vadensis TaxID=172901 RepID=UPI0026DCF76E|nr:type II secretion system protein [Victivallis vadensis]